MDKKQKRIWTLVGLAVGGLLLGTLIFGAVNSVQTQCELCVEFRGQRQCRRGAGPNQAEAQQAAVRAACAVMAGSMDESIACTRVPPTDMTCTG